MKDEAKIHKHLEYLKIRALESHKKLEKKFPHIARKLKKLDLDLKDLRRHSARMLAGAALAGAAMVVAPKLSSTLKPPAAERQISQKEVRDLLKDQLADVLMDHKIGKPLPSEVESQASQVIRKTLGIDAVAELEGNHLNTSYGYMGAEQHLPRYPGDTVVQHDEIQKSGITSGRGGWGYFARSKKEMTQEAFFREKYYVAVQTMYLPNWKKDLKYLVNWYKYRKVLVVNPNNGKSIVAVVADAGPAAWTGKHFGGSPEVMAHLELNVGKQKGAVLMLFVDDRERQLALGPVVPQQTVFLSKR